ncbi:MAG: flavin reductase family protein [Thermoplasmata archaeon]|nr:flavin reductase family protein [Thermoplasmata archaeon]
MTDAPSVDPIEFRQWMSRWPTGVSIVTTHHEGADYGLTVNAFLSVTLDPATVLICLTHDADSTPPILRSGRFTVNELAYDQKEWADRFAQASSPVAKFAGMTVERGEHQVPRLTDTIGSLSCRVVEPTVTVGDHRIILGRVEGLRRGRDVPPLLFVRRGYAISDGDRSELLPSA